MIPLRDSIRSDKLPVITIGLIIANALVFFWELLLTQEELRRFVYVYGVVPRDFKEISIGDPVLSLQIIGTLFTATFLHAGWIHFLSNMLYLWVFADNVEDRMGKERFLVFYLVAGAIANYAHVIANPNSSIPTIGASGAVAAVLGAYFLSFPRSKILTLLFLGVFFTIIEVPAVMFLFIWFGLQVVSGLASIGAAEVTETVAWWAHIGGFLAGMVMVGLFSKKEARESG